MSPKNLVEPIARLVHTIMKLRFQLCEFILPKKYISNQLIANIITCKNMIIYDNDDNEHTPCD